MKQVILASASPRRRELLAQLGLDFTVEPSDASENFSAEDPSEIAIELATRKAKAVADKQPHRKECLIIGADTIVVRDDEVLNKPEDESDACRMLTSLQGQTHQVHTGVALLRIDEQGKQHIKSFSECTKVFVDPMTKDEIQAYIATGQSMDKAGAYGIQGSFAKHINRIEGDYFNVVGLPLARLYKELTQIGKCST